MSDDETVHVTPVGVNVNRRGVWTVLIGCPFCGRVHTHGWQEAGSPGLRVAHCGRGDGKQYYIDPAPTVEVNE